MILWKLELGRDERHMERYLKYSTVKGRSRSETAYSERREGMLVLPWGIQKNSLERKGFKAQRHRRGSEMWVLEDRVG